MREHHEEFHPKIQKIYYHCREKSDKRFQKCDILSTDSLTLIKYHYKIEHSKPFNPFECLICDKNFDIKEDFLQHLSCKHGKSYDKLQCEACKNVYYAKKLFTVHKFGCFPDETPPILCEFCEFTCITQNEIFSHIQEHHKGI